MSAVRVLQVVLAVVQVLQAVLVVVQVLQAVFAVVQVLRAVFAVEQVLRAVFAVPDVNTEQVLQAVEQVFQPVLQAVGFLAAPFLTADLQIPVA